MSYVSQFGRPARFGYLPVLRQDAWDLFTGETTKKLTLQVARMENFENVERTQGSFEDQMIEWSQLFGAPTIEITLRARGRDGHLNNDEAQGTIERFINYAQEVMGIKKIQAETVEGDEPYNFLQQLLQEKSTLDLPANDPAAARNIRMNFVKECYDEHRDHFQQVYVHPAEH
jgi:hypothetical protein